MARKKDELLKAKTCKHGVRLTKLGGLFVKKSCPNEKVIKLPVVDNISTGKTIKVPYILAKRCNECEHYKKGTKRGS